MVTMYTNWIVMCLVVSGVTYVARSQDLPLRLLPNTVQSSDGGLTCPDRMELDAARLDASMSSADALSEIAGLLNVPKSCEEIINAAESFTPGYYRIKIDNGSTIEVYCTESGQGRIEHLDMSDPLQSCPSPWVEVTDADTVRSCKRSTRDSGCESITISTNGLQYNQVCGKILGYQGGLTQAFLAYYNNNSLTIDDAYFDGMVLTVGAPGSRQHIWSWVASLTEAYNGCECNCKCTNYGSPSPADSPPWVGNDYFCETAQTAGWNGLFYSDDPLWDGDGCGPGSTCCSFPGVFITPALNNVPPNFCKQLPFTTTEDLELRICQSSFYHSGFHGVAVEVIDLSVQLV